MMFGIYKWSAKRLQKEMNRRYTGPALTLPSLKQKVS